MGFLNDPQAVMGSGYTPGAIASPVSSGGYSNPYVDHVNDLIGIPVSSGGYSNPIGINVGSLPSMAPTGTINNVLAGGPTGTGSGVGGFLSNLGNLGNAVGGFLGGTGGQLIGAGLSIDELNKITDIAQRSAAEQAAIGREAQEASAFRPFTVSTGFGGVTATPTGGYTTTLSPAMAAQQRALQGITSGLLGGMGGMGGMGVDYVRQPGDPGYVTNGPVPPPPETSFKTPMSPEQAMAARISGAQTLLPGTLTEDTMRFRADPRVGIARPPGTPEPPRMYTDQLTGKRVTQEEVDALGGMTTLQAPRAPYDLTVAERTGFSGIMEQAGLSPAQRFQILPQTGFGTGPATGGFGAGIPDVSGIQRQALGGVGGFLTGAMAPMAQREADVYERIRATQRPEEQRAQLALEERLAAQGRTGLRTAQFGGSPEQLALAQAQEEAKARASLGALGQAQAEQLQQMGLAESMFGLGGRAAGLPQALQAGQLGNIGTAMGLQYLPEQQLLGTLTPALSLADLAGVGQRQGAGYMSQAGISGLEDILQAETVRSQNLRDIYSTILGAQANQQAAQTAAAGTAATNTGLFSSIGNIGSAIVDLFT
jgi:hypothetical protein